MSWPARTISNGRKPDEGFDDGMGVVAPCGARDRAGAGGFDADLGPVTFLVDGDVVTPLPGSEDLPLELIHCMELALQANESLRQQRAGIDELGGRKTQAISTGLPRIEVQGAFSRGRDPSFALDETFAGGGNPYQPVIDYVDPLFDATGVIPPEVDASESCGVLSRTGGHPGPDLLAHLPRRVLGTAAHAGVARGQRGRRRDPAAGSAGHRYGEPHDRSRSSGASTT